MTYSEGSCGVKIRPHTFGDLVWVRQRILSQMLPLAGGAPIKASEEKIGRPGVTDSEDGEAANKV